MFNVRNCVHFFPTLNQYTPWFYYVWSLSNFVPIVNRNLFFFISFSRVFRFQLSLVFFVVFFLLFSSVLYEIYCVLVVVYEFCCCLVCATNTIFFSGEEGWGERIFIYLNVGIQCNRCGSRVILAVVWISFVMFILFDRLRFFLVLYHLFYSFYCHMYHMQFFFCFSMYFRARSSWMWLFWSRKKMLCCILSFCALIFIVFLSPKHEEYPLRMKND